MASPTTTLDTLITLKVNHDGLAKRFKLPLRDLTMVSLEDKIRNFLQIPAETVATIERYSDSAATFVTIEKDNVPVYKQLFRAAKAKHKLKLRVTTQVETPVVPKPVTVEDEPEGESAQTTSILNFSAPSTSTTEVSVTSIAEDISQTTSETAQESRAETPVAPINMCKRTFTVCCNKCDRAVPDAHFHCSTCDDGDFDLCEDCVNEGVTCHDDGHWLIKRTIKDGEISYSTTQVAPKKTPAVVPSVAPAPVHTLPIRLLERPATRVSLAPTWTTAYNARTCNSCVQEYPEQEFVHCTTCDDFDLCKGCFVKDQHGHHPKHAFTAAAKGTVFDQSVSARLSAGRNILHNAICDGCDQYVRGVRHKCLDCPDWDYCSDCVENAGFIHPNHRFVPIYEPLSHPTFRASAPATHFGICCDGPLCASRRGGLTRYIVGDRYKCAVCHDTDFCANCEASPANTHNKTHPLIKFKTPVRHVSVTTTGEHEDGQRLPPMGDRSARRQGSASRSGETTPSARESIAASPVQTVVDVQPTEQQAEEDVQAEPVETKQEVAVQTEKEPLAAAADLIATFQHDTVADGSIMPPSHTFEQTWVLRNEGTAPWPAGCSVKFVGGDYMGAVDPSHPAGLHELVSASESTICYNALNPGQEFPFTVLMRTPDREGKVISYWRLTTSDGIKFGHKLWCDVQVQKPVYTFEPEIVAEAPAETVRSQMIIPRLEHESPSASILEDRTAEEEALTETETSSQSVRDREEDDFEDCAEVDDWANDSDDGFMTDEEYDILDASDEEYLSEQHKTAASRR